MMKREKLVFLLASLLFCSGSSDVQMGMSQHLDHPNPMREMEFSYHDQAMEKIVYCPVCKIVLKKVLQLIEKTASKEEIDQQLDQICNKIRIRGCKTFLLKYKTRLVTALLSGNHVEATCIKLKLCKRIDMQTIQ